MNGPPRGRVLAARSSTSEARVHRHRRFPRRPRLAPVDAGSAGAVAARADCADEPGASDAAPRGASPGVAPVAPGAPLDRWRPPPPFSTGLSRCSAVAGEVRNLPNGSSLHMGGVRNPLISSTPASRPYYHSHVFLFWKVPRP